MSKWNYRYDTNSTAAAIYGSFEFNFIRKNMKNLGLSQDQNRALIGNLRSDHFTYRKVMEIDENDLNKGNFWCVSNESDFQYPCLYNIIRSFEEAYVQLNNSFGSDMSNWNWGDIHHLRYAHTPFSQSPLKPIYHRSKPVPGNTRTAFASYIRAETETMEGVVSTNERMVMSMREGDPSYYIIDTGISGNPFSSHYTDQMDLFLKGEYLEVPNFRKVNNYKHVFEITSKKNS